MRKLRYLAYLLSLLLGFLGVTKSKAESAFKMVSFKDASCISMPAEYPTPFALTKIMESNGFGCKLTQYDNFSAPAWTAECKKPNAPAKETLSYFLFSTQKDCSDFLLYLIKTKPEFFK